MTGTLKLKSQEIENIIIEYLKSKNIKIVEGTQKIIINPGYEDRFNYKGSTLERFEIDYIV